jgi:hypothetical protein
VSAAGAELVERARILQAQVERHPHLSDLAQNDLGTRLLVEKDSPTADHGSRGKFFAVYAHRRAGLDPDGYLVCHLFSPLAHRST